MMSESLILITGGLIVLSLGSFIAIRYRNHRNLLSYLSSEVEKAEKDLLLDMQEIGLDELAQTQYGRELLEMRGVRFGRGLREQESTDNSQFMRTVFSLAAKFDSLIKTTKSQHSSTSSHAAPDKEAREGYLRSFSIYATIPAGGFGSIPEPIAWIEIDRVWIDQVPHFVVNLHEGRKITLFDTVHYVAIKVKGDSMNIKKINDGDYVLMRVQEVAENGDIVAAEIHDNTIPDDEKTTLKQFFRRDGKFFLEPQSTNPRHRSLIFSDKDPALHIRGVAIAILKKLAD